MGRENGRRGVVDGLWKRTGGGRRQRHVARVLVSVSWPAYPLTFCQHFTDHKVVRYVCFLDLRAKATCDMSVAIATT